MWSKTMATLALALAFGSAHAADEQVNVICSVQVEWCNLIRATFTRVSGIKVNIVQRSTGEALAQLNAEKTNPKTDRSSS